MFRELALAAGCILRRWRNRRTAEQVRAVVASIGGGLDQAALSRFAQSARDFAQRIPEGPGRQTPEQALGKPTNRLFCAVAALALMQAVRGKIPGHSNPDLLRLCSALWAAAGLKATPGQESGDTDDIAWERHTRAAKLRISARNLGDAERQALAQAREQVFEILRRHGLVQSSVRNLGRPNVM